MRHDLKVLRKACSLMLPLILRVHEADEKCHGRKSGVKQFQSLLGGGVLACTRI